MIVCGFRDDSGFVHTINDFPVKDIPKQAAEHWSPNVCMNFLDNLLNFIKAEMRNEELQVREFSWNPHCDIRSRLVQNPEEIEQLLPKWYKNEVFLIK